MVKGGNIIQKVKNLIKEEVVLCAAAVLAVLSMFFVPPDEQYIRYIDFRTLGILFALMSVMEGLKGQGVFRRLAQTLLAKVKSMKQLVIVLVMLCFFSGMLITNDVALITFVPLTIIVLGMLGEDVKRKFLVVIVVMQTIAANLGSMLTPIGNPQNLYLYGKSGMGIGQFVLLMLPYTIAAFVLLLVWSVCLCRKDKKALTVSFSEKVQTGAKSKQWVYLVLFLLSVLTVVRVVPVLWVVVVVFAVVLIMDRKVLARVDYSLLLTFVAFFVFIGNMGRVDVFYTLLSNVVNGNEILTAIVSSQVISNVPAALLLSGFSTQYADLIIGVNLGGLGTLIASMASLISFKYVVKEDKAIRGKYMMHFTMAGTVFLIILLGFHVLIQ